MLIQPISATLLCLFTCIAAGFDLRTRKIPNALNIVGAMAAILMVALGGVSPLDAVLGGLIGFGVFFGLFVIGVVGGGDVKMMGVVGLMLGYPYILNFLMVACIMSSAGGLIYLILTGKGGVLWRDLKRVLLKVLGPFSPLKSKHIASESNKKVPEEPMLSSPFAPGVFVAAIVLTIPTFITIEM